MRHANPNSRFNKPVFYIMFVIILTGLLLVQVTPLFAIPLALLAAVSCGEVAAS